MSASPNKYPKLRNLLFNILKSLHVFKNVFVSLKPTVI